MVLMFTSQSWFSAPEEPVTGEKMWFPRMSPRDMGWSQPREAFLDSKVTVGLEQQRLVGVGVLSLAGQRDTLAKFTAKKPYFPNFRQKSLNDEHTHMYS